VAGSDLLLGLIAHENFVGKSEVDGSSMGMYLAQPETNSPVPAIL